MAEPFAAGDVCDTCGSRDLHPWLVRSDGLRVLACPRCQTGVVEALPGDLDDIYEGDYYAGDPALGVGYGDYDFTAEHSVAWAAALVDALRPGGSAALDIGAADGLLLSKLGSAFVRRAGIEMNPPMAQVLTGRGLELLAHDVYDPALHDHDGAFDVVTAVAVFEHVPQFVRAVRRALDLTTQDGLLIFEVPLMSQDSPNDVWLTSSLEHLYYPTEASLRYLFEEVLGVQLHGSELKIAGYGSTFIGIASRDNGTGEVAGRTLHRVTGDTQTDDLTASERRARAQLRLLHAADTRSGLDALEALQPKDLTPASLRRLQQLWSQDALERVAAVDAAAELRDYLGEVERARDDAQHRAAEAEAQAARVANRLLEVAQARQGESEARAAALAAAADWERQAHLTHAQLDAVTSSTAWRATGPARAAVTSARRALQQAAVLKSQVNRRRILSAVELARHADVKAIRQRFSAVHGTAVAAAGLSVAIERGPNVPVVQEAWPDGDPLVSVVIICFNYGRYVEDAVRSALAQTMRRVEVIVVDGGSTDGTTPGVLLDLQRKYPDVRVVFREGRHLVGDNRNHGISFARGRYVCCLDADDALAPVYLEVAAYLLEAHDYDVVSTATRTFGLREETFGLLPRPTLEDMLLGNNVSTVAVFRRSMWEHAGGFHDTGTGPDHIHEDWKLWVRLAALGARIINITGQQLFLYRVHGEHSLSNLAGTPAIHHQRAAIASFNDDLVDERALDLSRQRREEVHEVDNALVNLLTVEDERQVTVLIALPFLIVGGAERLISQISAHLRAQGMRVVIVTTLPVDAAFGDTSDWFADATSEIYHLPRLLDVDRWERFLNYLIVSKGVDVLWQAGSAFVYALLPSLRAKHPHLRVVDLLFNTIGHTAANRSHASEIDLVLVENAEVESWLLAKGERPERVVRVDSGVDLTLFRPDLRHPVRKQLRVGYSGRLSEEKDPLAFLAIAAALSDRDDIEFVMTGAGPLESKVKAKLATTGLSDRVSLLGIVDDARAHLASLDVLVLPSRLDGRPVVVLEALALGVPVVASSVGALPQLVHDGVTGYLCAPGDPAAFAARLRRLADDRRTLDDMGRAARRFAELNLDAKVMFETYETALRSLAADGRSSGRTENSRS